MRVNLTTVFVVEDDIPRVAYRWLTVVSPEQPDGQSCGNLVQPAQRA